MNEPSVIAAAIKYIFRIHCIIHYLVQDKIDFPTFNRYCPAVAIYSRDVGFTACLSHD